jgi:hypothetical protein
MTLPRPSRAVGQPEEPKVKSSKIQYRPSDTFRFDPQPDISSYELACLVAVFLDVTVHSERFLQFPDNLQRHFRHHKI